MSEIFFFFLLESELLNLTVLESHTQTLEPS